MAWLVFAQVIIAVLVATPPSCTQRMPPAVPRTGADRKDPLPVAPQQPALILFAAARS
jgi:hypothetical protein